MTHPKDAELREIIRRLRANEISENYAYGRVVAIMSAEGLKNKLLDVESVHEEHLRHVSTFLSEIYSIMVDPCATGTITVSAMTTSLIEAAKIQREQLVASTQLNTQREGVKPCADFVTRLTDELDLQESGYMTFWSETTQCSRTVRRCDECNRLINIGESYNTGIGINADGDFSVWVAHHDCLAATLEQRKLADLPADAWWPVSEWINELSPGALAKLKDDWPGVYARAVVDAQRDRDEEATYRFWNKEP